jgi:hypothetical protein
LPFSAVFSLDPAVLAAVTDDDRDNDGMTGACRLVLKKQV